MRDHRGAARRAVTTLLALVLAALFLSAPSSPATAGAEERGRVRGEILSSSGPVSQVRLLWFDASWDYLGARKVRGGAYSLSLDPGTYFLQAEDLAPSFDVDKLRPATVKVVVRPGRTAVRTIRMERGASIGGTVRTGGAPGRGARVVAANTDEQSFETTADSRGRFALGGLPPGKYSVFTYDRRGEWVGKSLYLPKIRKPVYTPVRINLTTRAGGLLVDLYAGRASLRETVFVTAVSRATGQFWTARGTRGSVTFRGLHPGRYDLEVPGSGVYLPARVAVKQRVRPGRVAFGSARLTRRGAWVTGTLVDANNPSVALAGAAVRLLDASGGVVATATTDGSGDFSLDGPLLTQRGMTVVAGPGPGSPYLGQGASYCKYADVRVRDVSVRTGRRTGLGTVALAHLPNSQQDGIQCWTLLPDPLPDLLTP